MNDPASITLSPCPWCGEQPVFLADDSYGSCYLSCHNDACAAQPLVQAPKDMPELAYQRWNARAALAAPARAAPAVPVERVLALAKEWREREKWLRGRAVDMPPFTRAKYEGEAASMDFCAAALEALASSEENGNG